MMSYLAVGSVVVLLLVVWNVVRYFSFLNSIGKLLKMMFIARSHDAKHGKGPYSFLDTFEECVDKHGRDMAQFITAETGAVMTLGELEDLGNQVGNWGIAKGSNPCDTVAILMLNTPDYVALWLGFGKIGVSSSLLNTNLTGNALVHSVDSSLKHSEKKILFVDHDLNVSLADDLAMLKTLGVSIYFWSSDPTIKSVKQEVMQLSTNRIAKAHRSQITANDALLYIFTSGTTGLPKACKISQSRYFMSTVPYRTLCSLTRADRIYTVLPLYHSAAGLLGVGASLTSGACMVLRKKFSVSAFTSDCLKYKITSFQYIGELCRYLTAAAENVNDNKLTSLRTAYGNGMRPDVWTKFQKRYNIQHIVEFYGATEGNANLFNNFDQVGALGFIPRLLDPLYPLKIVRTESDDQTQPLRDVHTGKCVECNVNEVGLLVSQIFPSRKFDGYTDEKATNAKILRNVLKQGDMFFNTGDLLSRDAAGFYYWSDRIGDTFRWKGENVATTEVSAVVATCLHVKDVTVYGVFVPNCDGRAGMAAICATVVSTERNVETLSTKAVVHAINVEQTQEMLNDINSSCKAQLPPYARPLFLRIKAKGEQLKTTSTFKHIKTDLAKEGFDPCLVSHDTLYYYNNKTKEYQLLTPDVYAEIVKGKIMF